MSNISEETLKRILTYIYEQNIMAPNDSLRDIINDSLATVSIGLYMNDEGFFERI